MDLAPFSFRIRRHGLLRFPGPRMRDQMPTLPCDLAEYAWLQTGPESWSAFGAIDDELCMDEDSFVAGPLVGVSPRDVPRVSLNPAQRFEQGLDHRQGFVLALLDHCSDLETLLDMAGLPQAETLGILCELVARGVVTLESPPQSGKSTHFDRTG